jgi:hypothetical protein
VNLGFRPSSLLGEEFLSAPIHSPPLWSPNRSFTRWRGCRDTNNGHGRNRSRSSQSPQMELSTVGDEHEVVVPRGLEVQTPKPDFESGREGSELPIEYLWPLYSVRITIVTVVGKQILSARSPTWHTNCWGSLPPTVNFYRLRVGLGWLV